MAIAVCPKCFEPLVEGHTCGKQQAFTKQERKKYTHNIHVKRQHITVVFSLDVPIGRKFKHEWLHKQLKERMEIPEGPEDYPEVEDYYIKDIW